MNKTEKLHRTSVGHASAAVQSVVSSVIGFARKNPVLMIAAAAALLTSFIVPPDAEYLGYFDFRTLTCLFCTLAVICALGEIRFFYVCAEKIIALAKNLRLAALTLVYITFIGSMLIANDMALITFLPLGYIVLHCTGNEKHMAYVFILQNIAANLGGMLTPFGNPQNLYLYSYFAIPGGDFVSAMLPPFLFSVLIITLCCFVLPKSPISYSGDITKMPRGRLVCYLALFALSILVVFRGIPYQFGLFVIPTALIFLDRRALGKVDYALLMTFVCFFIFSGNMSRIGAVSSLMEAALGGSAERTLFFSAMSCQAISNVPSAILLSKFTENWRALLYGVNIGGCGTLISSLASLITFRTYNARCPGRSGYYIALFSLLNFGFLAALLVLCSLIL